MTGQEERETAAELVHREAHYLDEARWDDWLALYDTRAVFWVPAWKDENELTGDPDSEISLIYITSRTQLEERISRLRAGTSAASAQPLRTAHMLSSVLTEPGETADEMTVRSVATTHLFDVRRQESYVYFGRCEHRLIRADGGWLIRQKKVVVLNDYLPTVMDFYTV